MRSRITIISLAAGAVAAVMLLVTLAGPNSANAARTCSGTLGIAVHGQHIVGDYVTGIGGSNIDWPPKGGVVGQAIAGEGVVIPGGPGPGFHFVEGFAPGASFCLDQSQAPGFHPGP
jgi:hypothetical protein